MNENTVSTKMQILQLINNIKNMKRWRKQENQRAKSIHYIGRSFAASIICVWLDDKTQTIFVAPLEHDWMKSSITGVSICHEPYSIMYRWDCTVEQSGPNLWSNASVTHSVWLNLCLICHLRRCELWGTVVRPRCKKINNKWRFDSFPVNVKFYVTIQITSTTLSS